MLRAPVSCTAVLSQLTHIQGTDLLGHSTHTTNSTNSTTTTTSTTNTSFTTSTSFMNYDRTNSR